jgi:four helix bundle protein
MDGAEILRRRTMRFALDTIGFCRTLPRGVESEVIGRQLLKAGTSLGANYRASCCGRSDGEWFSKLCIAREEADESEYWLTILTKTEMGNGEQRQRLLQESGELARILSKSILTFQQSNKCSARRNRRRRKVANARQSR